MKNYQISPGQIPHLVRVSADLFRTMNKEIQVVCPPAEKSTQMQFVADLLKDLVNTAYPEKEESKSETITDEEVNKSLYDAYLSLSNIFRPSNCLILNFEEFNNELYEKGLRGEK